MAFALFSCPNWSIVSDACHGSLLLNMKLLCAYPLVGREQNASCMPQTQVAVAQPERLPAGLCSLRSSRRVARQG